jgi:membrane protease YdiL (CAAX protease family)
VFGRGLKTLGELHPSPATLAWAAPACLLWLCLEVGVTEEGLFRAVLQTRLAAALRGEGAAIFAQALLFGLAHAPGLYLRGAYAMEGLAAPPTPGWAVAYSIAVISPAGFVFGVLWSRTRSFSLIVLLHALTDLLPNLAPFIRDFTR